MYRKVEVIVTHNYFWLNITLQYSIDSFKLVTNYIALFIKQNYIAQSLYILVSFILMHQISSTKNDS